MTLTISALTLCAHQDGWDAEAALLEHAHTAGVQDTLSLLSLADTLANDIEAHGDEDNDTARDLLTVLEAWEDDPEAALHDITLAAS